MVRGDQEILVEAAVLTIYKNNLYFCKDYGKRTSGNDR